MICDITNRGQVYLILSQNLLHNIQKNLKIRTTVSTNCNKLPGLTEKCASPTTANNVEMKFIEALQVDSVLLASVLFG